MRLFIGVGWLRAGAEKLVDPGWRDGASLHTFLTGQLAAGGVSFPLYRDVMHDVFMPSAAALDWIICVGQLLVGLALVTGTLTNAALLGGLFMNLNFMLAGKPDPSVFYLVIQSALFLSNAGATVGVDGWLSRYLQLDCRHPIFSFAIARHRRSRTHMTFQRRTYLAIAALSLVFAGIGLAHVRDFTPGGSVKDSAMVLAVLALTWCVSAISGYVRRIEPRHRLGRVRPALVEALGRERSIESAA